MRVYIQVARAVVHCIFICVYIYCTGICVHIYTVYLYAYIDTAVVHCISSNAYHSLWLFLSRQKSEIQR